jgi:hypothetical protein
MRLADWLKDEKLSYAAAARAFGCSRPACYYYAIGRTIPGAQFTENIRRSTGGQVTADDHHAAYWAVRS